MDRMPFGQVQAERSKMLTRLQGMRVPDSVLHQRAVAVFSSRLDQWMGIAAAPLTRFAEKKPWRLPATLTADPVELLIAQAISESYPPTFGVMADGAVLTTDNGLWDESGHAVFVTGLSRVLDEAADVFRHHTQGGGGRFFESGGGFYFASRFLNDRIAVAADIAQPRLGKPFAIVRSEEERLPRRVGAFFRNLRSTAGAIVGRQPPAGQDPVETFVVDFEAGTPRPPLGVLKDMGYRAGKSGLFPHQRREILRRVFLVKLVARSPHTKEYIREWGEPGSDARDPVSPAW